MQQQWRPGSQQSLVEAHVPSRGAQVSVLVVDSEASVSSMMAGRVVLLVGSATVVRVRRERMRVVKKAVFGIVVAGEVLVLRRGVCCWRVIARLWVWER